MKYQEIADRLGVSLSAVKSWASRYWKKEDQEKVATKGCNRNHKKVATNKTGVGAPEGNVNAVGNPGGGAPIGNTNALKHGGYSPVYWDTLTDEEKELLAGEPPDGEQLLLDEITLLSIRERRIMASIRKYSEIKGGQAVAGIVRSETKREFDSDEDREQYETIQREKVSNGEILPGRGYHLSTRTEATYDIIHRLEESLTRCQAQKQKCIASLNELRIARGKDGKQAPESNLLEALIFNTAEEIETDDISEIFQAAEHSHDVVEPTEAEEAPGNHL